MNIIVNIIAILGILFITLMISLLEYQFPAKTQRRIVVILNLGICCYLGIRSVGLDLGNYYKIYMKTPIVHLNGELISTALTDELELYFRLIISTCKQLGLGFNGFLFISALVPMVLSVYVIDKETHPILTYCLFLFINLLPGPVNIIRNFYAMGIYLFALKLVSERKWLLGGGIMYSAAFAHYSATIGFITLPLSKLKWNLQNYTVAITFTFLISMVLRGIIFTIFETIDTSGSPLLNDLRYYLIVYNEHQYHYQGNLHKIMLYLIEYSPLFINLITVPPCLEHYEWFKENKFHDLLLKTVILGNFIGLVAVVLNARTIALRMVFLFGVGNFILLKELIVRTRRTSKTALYTLVVFLVFCYNMIILLYYMGIHMPTSRFYLGGFIDSLY